MRRTRPALRLLALAALLPGAAVVPLTAGPAAAGPAAAAADGLEAVTTTEAKIDVTDGPQGGVPRPVTLDTTLYVPEGASADDPRPAIVMTNGFGLSKSAAEIVSTSTYLARHGYVVLAYTAAGFGGSTGCISLQSADFDARSTSELIDTVLEPRDDVLHDELGVVAGTVGGSYGGGGQLVLAGTDERVRAAAPGRTWNSLRYSLDPNNRVAPGDPTGFSHELNAQGVFKAEWSGLFFASGNAQPVGGVPPSGGPKGGCPGDPYRSLPSVPVAGVPCIGFIGQVCETFARITATGDTTQVDRDLLDRASAETFLPQLRIPVLLVQGQRDTLFNVNDALATYTDLRARGVPVTMIWNWGGHGGYDSRPGECETYGGGTGGADYTGLEGCYLTSRTLAFFDAALRGEGDAGPGFAWYRDDVAYDGDGSADEQYGSAPAFPALPSTTYALSGVGDLVPAGGPVSAGSATVVNPPGALPGSPLAAYSETSNFSGPASSPRDPREPSEVPGQHADFTSPPFASSVESVGVPSAHLLLSHTNGSDLVLFGKVYDVAPDGTAELVHRLIAPVRVPAAAVAAPVDLKLIGFAHRFEAGHRVRLTLATTDQTSRNSQLPDTIAVATGTGSTFSLPLPAGAVTVPPAPTTPGTTPPTPPTPPTTPATPATPTAAPRGELPRTGATAALPALAAALVGGALVLRRRRRTA